MSFTLEQSLRSHIGPISSVKFSHKEDIVASTSADSSISFYKFNSGDNNYKEISNDALEEGPTTKNINEEEDTCPEKQNSNLDNFGEISYYPLLILGNTKGSSSLGLNDLAFSPDDKYLAVASDDTSVGVWDIEYIKQTVLYNNFDNNGNDVRDIKGKEGLSINGSGKTKIDYFNKNKIGTGYLAEKIGLLVGHRSWVIGCKYDRSGTIILTYGFDETARIFDVRSNMCVKTLRAHTEPVTSACFVDINNYVLATASLDGSVKIWDIRYDHILKTFTRKIPSPILDVSTNYSVDRPKEDFMGRPCYLTMNVYSEVSGKGENTMVIFDVDNDRITCEVPLQDPTQNEDVIDMFLSGGFFGQNSAIYPSTKKTLTIVPFDDIEHPIYYRIPEKNNLLSYTYNRNADTILVGTYEGEIQSHKKVVDMNKTNVSTSQSEKMKEE